MEERFDKIIEEITSKLSGDNEKDLKYLHEMCEQYKNHKYAKEIIRALSRLMYDMLPDDSRNEIDRLVKNQEQSYSSVIEEVRFNIYKRDFNKALSIIEPFINTIEEGHLFENDNASIFFTFNELFEEVLYREINKPEKDVRRATTPYSQLYFLYGSLLVEMEKTEEAASALEKALRWNPCDSQIRFEYIETFKMRKMLTEYQEQVSEAFKYIYRPEFLARGYRDFGYYFIEKKMYAEALTMYQLSLEFDKENKNAISELYYIEQTVGKEVKPLSNCYCSSQMSRI